MRLIPLLAIGVGWALAQRSSSASVSPAWQAPEKRYDGHWWVTIANNERRGFVDGYLDCYTYEFKGPASFHNRPPVEIQQLVTAFYSQERSRANDRVPEVLYRFQDRAGDTLRAREDGEAHPEPHGYYDGQYWFEQTNDGRLGFIEGYLHCHAMHSRRSGGFSRRLDEYRALISRWYGIREGTADLDEARAPGKIADVLFRFRDRPARR
jgi:hypothetical protein